MSFLMIRENIYSATDLLCLSNQHDKVIMSIFFKKIDMRKSQSAKKRYLCGRIIIYKTL